MTMVITVDDDDDNEVGVSDDNGNSNCDGSILTLFTLSKTSSMHKILPSALCSDIIFLKLHMSNCCVLFLLVVFFFTLYCF